MELPVDILSLNGFVASTPPVAKPKPTPKPMIRRTRFCIPLPSRYVPGSGPPLPPLRLAPPHDSTAYIKDRLLIPSTGLAANGRALPKRMMYLVGWRDLPAATALVPAMKVLEYVSPYALEEWEARFEQEIDDEQARLEVAKQKEEAAFAAAAAAAAAATPTTTEALMQVAKRKRGRPPAHSKIEAAVVAEPETVAKAKSQPKRGSMMAMASPQQIRLREFEGMSFADDDDDELAGDYAFDDLDQGEGDDEDEEELYDAPPFDDRDDALQSAVLSDAARNGTPNDSASLLVPNPRPTMDSNAVAADAVLSANDGPRNASPFPASANPSRSTAPIVPPPPPPASTQVSQIQLQRGFQQLFSQNGQAYRQTSAPIRHHQQRLLGEQSLRPESRPGEQRSQQQQFRNRPHHRSQSPQVRQYQELRTLHHHWDELRTLPSLRYPNPSIPSPNMKVESPNQKKASSRGLTPPASKASSQPPAAESLPISGFKPQNTPAPRNPSSEGSRHTSSSAKRPASEENTTTPAPAAKRRPRSKDPEYFVECLEDVRFHGDPNEGIVRDFKVRWEGDWPPDQKTTWEPEANIPAAMVKTFMKTWRQHHNAGERDRDGKIKSHNKSKKKSSPQQHTTLAWPSERRYSSVTEAFAGDGDSMPEQGGSSQVEVGGDTEEIFVVSEEEGGGGGGGVQGGLFGTHSASMRA